MFSKRYKAALLQNCTPVKFHHNIALKNVHHRNIVPECFVTTPLERRGPKVLKRYAAILLECAALVFLKCFSLPTVFKEKVVKPLSGLCADDLFKTLCDNLIDKVIHLISFPGPKNVPEYCF